MQQQEARTLWIGDVEAWMDEAYISSLFAQTRSVVGVKVIRDKVTGLPCGYGFVEFGSHEVANQVLTTMNGKPIPNTQKVFRLNWGSYGGANKAVGLPNQQVQQKSGESQSIYVGDLDPQVTNLSLFEFYHQKYPSTLSAKVIIDSMTRLSKGYGFVEFSSREEGMRAQQETNGALLKGRHIKTNNAVMKSAAAQQEQAQYLQQVYNQLGMNNQQQQLMAQQTLAQQQYYQQQYSQQQYLQQQQSQTQQQYPQVDFTQQQQQQQYSQQQQAVPQVNLLNPVQQQQQQQGQQQQQNDQYLANNYQHNINQNMNQVNKM